MREIEVKARVHNESTLRAALDKAGIKLSPAIKQHDIVYSRPGAVDDDPDENWLRIRTEDDNKHILTLKRSLTGELDSVEHEVVIDDPSEMKYILGYLGYQLYSDLTKIRQKSHVGPYEICLDTVPDLGVFIEVEKLCADDADVAAVTDELWQILSPFGVTPDDAETHGYDVLQRQRDGLAPAT